MALTQLAPPYPIFTDKNGDPLDAGFLYFGVADQNPETNPITVYFDNALTQPAAQPIRTINGYPSRNGSPAAIYTDQYFSVTVRNKKNELVIYAPSGYGVTPGTSASFTDQMTYNQGSAGAIDRTLTSKLQEGVSVKDFGAVGDGVTNDYQAIQDAIDYATIAKDKIIFPPGVYGVETTLFLKSDVTLDLTSGATIKRNFNISPLGRALMAIVSGSKNMAVLGGVFDGNGDQFTLESFNIFGGGGVENLTIDGTTFLDVINFHAVDLTDALNITIKNCKFMGFWLKDPAREFSEAIQTDPGYGTTLGFGFIDNFVVDNCYFGPNPDNTDPNFGAWPSAVGNHSANRSEIVHKNIRVVNCLFDSLTYGAVTPYAWDDVVISNNNFESCARGVYVHRGTGTLTRGTTNCVIEGNTFNNCGTDIHIRNNLSAVATSYNTNISVSNNSSINANSFVRCYWADGLVVANNVVKGRAGLTTIFMACPGDFFNKNRNILVTGNTATRIFLFFFAGLDAENLSVTNNNASNLSGRFAHVTGSGTRRNVNISNNTIVDCDAIAYIAIDTEPVVGANVSNNKMLIGPENKSISGGSSIIALAQAGSTGYIFDNTVDTTLIDKRPFSPFGIVKAMVLASPETALTAAPGSFAMNITNGDIYIKTTGNGNTGWVLK